MEDFDNLSADEIRQLIAAYQAKNQPQADPEEVKIREEAEQRIQTLRREKELAPKVLAYKKALYAARGNRHQLSQIRERFARQGVPVDSITFDGNGGATWNGKPIEGE